MICNNLSASNTHSTRWYGLATDELRYILDPKEVHGEDSSTLPTVAGRISLAKLSTW